MLGAAGRAAAGESATGSVSASAPSTAARSSVRRRAAMKTRADMPQRLRLAARPRVALLGPVGPEVPEVALGIADREIARAVVGVHRLHHHLGARGLRPFVQR